MKPDSIGVEVIRAALNAAAERMRITMIKTAYNHIISESLDFGCAIFDPDVQMIAQGIGLPVFQGHLRFPIQATIADRGLEAFREGDVFIHNDPYTGNGNHLNDVAMTAPVFWQGRLAGFAAVKAHWSDVGGPVPSSMQIGSTDFRQEGLRFRSVRLVNRGELNEEVMRIIAGNIRTESGTLKDIQAMLAVCRAGDQFFREVLDKYGREAVLEATRVYMAQSERRTRAVLAVEEPAPTGRYYVPVNLLLDLGLRALAPAMPAGVPAGSYGDQMPTIAFGTHPQTGKLFIQGDLNAGGTGARPTFDGESAMIIFAGSTARNNPVEVVESRLPSIRIMRYALRQDSGGAGRHRGGLGIEREYQFLLPAFITFSLERKATPPWGLWGGKDGAVNGVDITSPDGALRQVRKATQHPIAAGEVVRIMTGGGGGYGPPSERAPDAVRRDVREGYVSREAAGRDYGVDAAEPE